MRPALVALAVVTGAVIVAFVLGPGYPGYDAAWALVWGGQLAGLLRPEAWVLACNDGVARRARAELGVTGWGMQVYEFPPNWDGHPHHAHDEGTEEAGQEEVYIPLAGSAKSLAGDETYDLRPGTMARVAPARQRRILSGPEGFQYVAIGGLVGAHTPSPWTELGGPWPTPPSA